MITLNLDWEAPGWQVIAVDAVVKQVITSWLQTLDNSVFTLVPLCGKCQDGSGDNIEILRVPSASHVHVLIKATVTFWNESVCYLVYWKFFVYTLQSEQVSS